MGSCQLGDSRSAVCLLLCDKAVLVLFWSLFP